MSNFLNQVSEYVTGSLSNLASTNFSTYALSLLSDAASSLQGRSVGSSESYNAFLEYVSSLGHTPKGVFGKSYPFIYSAMVGNNARADEISEGMFNFPKFTFYKSKPDIVLLDPENDIKDYFGQFIPDASFSLDMKHGYELKYSEEKGNIELFTPHPGDYHGSVGSYNATPSSLGANDLISKTNELFNQGRINSLVARFHTTGEQYKDEDNQTQTAISTEYGMSHGRNLLSGHDPSVNGYDNPYCRVWTYHHQYKDYARTMRPFVDGYSDADDNLDPVSQKDLNDTYSWYAFGNNNGTNADADNFDGSGRGRLDKLGVLSNKTGKPNIVPIYTNDGTHPLSKGDKTVDIKNCMFSIENLAWKKQGRQSQYFDINGLSDEQKGPMGGRIMWFPPYNLSFNEHIKPQWSSTEFIGRGEPIYTYKNTTRTGDLNFTLLIDHPAVLDYWKGWEKNGQRNNGKKLASLNTGGVDNPNNQEQTILRFFAGCDILEATPRQCAVKKVITKTIETENTDPTPDTPAVSEPKKLIFFVYFPNNYSGKDDTPQNAMYYLINGIGSQKASKLSTANTISGSSMNIDYLIPTLEELTVSGIGQCGGYEMRDTSVDICSASSVQDLTYTGVSTANCEYSNYITTGSPGKRAFQYVYKKPDGTNVTSPLAIHDSSYELISTPITSEAVQFHYGSGPWYLAAKQIFTGATKSWESNKDRYLYRWYYRVDSDTESQLLKVPHGYIDGTSNKLNSEGYTTVSDYLNESLTGETSNITLVSFTDAFVALEGSKATSLLTGLYDSTRVQLVKDVLNGTGNIKISSIDIYGAASSHGNNKVYNSKTKKVESKTSVDMSRNNSLASNRAETVQKYLNTMTPNSQLIHYHSDDKTTMTSNKAVYSTSILKDFEVAESTTNVDDLKEKIYRSAAVVIEYTEESVTDATKTISPIEDSTALASASPSVTTVNGKSSEASQLTTDVATARQSVESNGTLTQASAAEANVVKNATNKTVTTITEETYETVQMPRYDNEGEFFKELKTHDPSIMSLISQKVQYFDPAFHSISPEGFAARLTFLNQCTRQGYTVGASDVNMQTANNLAFGAPPVCVLRIGDFYYTRIIIDDINITYDKPIWDLNQEGIGVMPMMADVKISFSFVGGSDLGGPISRLQNAVSFNYYANTSVYDNRAEQVKYGENGEMTHFKSFEVDQSTEQSNKNNT